MSYSSVFGINNRFKFVTAIAALSIVLIVAMFIRSFLLMQEYDNNVQLAEDLIKEQQNMQKYELLFYAKYSEKKGFFKTGRHKYINYYEASSIRFNNILDELNLKFESADIEKNISNLKSLNNEYFELFKQLNNSLYLRGSESTGIISEIGKNSDNVILYVRSTRMKNKCVELNRLFNEYLIYGDNIYYNDFGILFDQIANSINNQIVRTESNENILISDDNRLSNSDLVEQLNKFRVNFKKLYEIDKKIGFNSEEGLKKSLTDVVLKFKPELEAIKDRTKLERKKYYKGNLQLMIVLGIALLIVVAISGFVMFRNTSTGLSKLNSYFKPLSMGIMPNKLLDLKKNSELQEMNDSINELIKGLKRTTQFTQQIGRGTFDRSFEPLSDQDTLGNSLIEMQKNLVKAQEEDKKRKEEDSYRKWASDGLTEFNEILRQNADNIDKLTLSIVRNITKFLNANQAGLFLINDTNSNDIHLELVATYAYDHERKKIKKIYLGEGLVGMCAVEKSTVYLEDIPEDYLHINSGLGGASPRSLLIVPLKIEEEIFGVIEIASFNTLKQHEIEFVEKVTESISSTLSLAKISARTAMLLEKSQSQAEQMVSQEEEMLVRLQELNADREKSIRKEAEMGAMVEAINRSSYVIEFDINGYITHANQAFLELLNLEIDQLVGKHQSDFENMDKANIRPESFWQRLRDGETIVEEHKIFSGKNTKWLHEIYTPILDKSGKPYKILNLSTDITVNKKLEEELVAKTEKISAQREELKQSVSELTNIQKEMQDKQIELQNANNKVKANEKILKNIINKTKENENKLKQRNAELAAQEVQNVKHIQNIELKFNRINARNVELKKSNNKLKNNEITLRNSIEELKEKNIALEKEIEKLKAKK